MKIVFIGQKGIPAHNGGVEKYVENLSANLVQQGHEVLVYARQQYNAGIKEYKGVRIISLPSLPGKNFEAISHTLFACFDLWFRKVDVINFESIGPSSLVWLVRLLKPRTPIVFTFHCQDYYHQKWGRFAKWYLHFGEKTGCKLAHRTITVSKGLNKYAREKYNIDPVYIPNGVSAPEIVSVSQIRRWGLEKDSYIVAISRLIRHKGLHYLIEAYKQLKTDKKLVIVGEGSYTNDYVQELYKLAEGNDNIIFTGNQSGRILGELFSNAYTFVQPSESEGLSISLLEAMSYHKACLVSDIDANTEALGDTGLVFQNKNIKDLADKLDYLLKNPAEVVQMGQRASTRVHKEYNWKDIAQNVIEVYNSLTSKKK